MTHRLIPPLLLVVIAVTGCGRQPEALAAAASPALGNSEAPSLVNTPVGPLPGEPEAARVDPANPFGTDAVATMQGRRLFTSFNCAGCHGDHGGGGMGPSLRDERWLYGSSDAHIANSIAAGRAHGMPAWGSKITTAQAWQLAAYIKSMRTPREPEPPAGN